MRPRAVLPALASLAAAGSIPDGSPFNLMALRSASDVHFAPFNAALSSIFLHLPEQNATCDAESDGTATFYLEDGSLFLYGDDDDARQQLFADRSGMGKSWMLKIRKKDTKANRRME